MSKKKVKKKVVVGNKNKKVASTATKSVKVKQTKKTTPTVSRRSAASKAKAPKEELLFGKQNYILMIAGAGLVILGMVAMLGGSMPDPNTWDPDIIYSKRITVLGPILIMSGLILEIYAIFKK